MNSFVHLPSADEGEYREVIEQVFLPVVEIECLKRKDYLTPKEIKKLYGITPKTLANKRSLSTGPKYIKEGKTILYPHKDLKRYLNRSAVEPGAPTA